MRADDPEAVVRELTLDEDDDPRARSLTSLTRRRDSLASL